jgi:hypothetical protein
VRERERERERDRIFLIHSSVVGHLGCKKQVKVSFSCSGELNFIKVAACFDVSHKLLLIFSVFKHFLAEGQIFLKLVRSVLLIHELIKVVKTEVVLRIA